jgi:hypothetical protein
VASERDWWRLRGSPLYTTQRGRDAPMIAALSTELRPERTHYPAVGADLRAMRAPSLCSITSGLRLPERRIRIIVGWMRP